MSRSDGLGVVLDEPGSIATELGAWLKAAAQLVEARWRLGRQRLLNRHGLPGAGGRLDAIAPTVAVAAVVVFGALFGLRLVQESSPVSLDGADGVVGSVAAVATSSSNAGTSAGVDPSPGAGSSVIVVHPGDSLWSIAVERFPGHDPREVVEAFVDTNGSSMIQSGQQLIVPAALVRN